jgi:EmrB/QacA subfamily drug resistance transporter
MTRSKQIWTLALTGIAFLMVTLDGLVVVTALPAIHRQLGGGLAQLEWTINAFSLTFAAGIIPAAALGDRYGRRRVFASGLALFTAASSVCALAPTTELLIAARAIQGLGAAAVMPLSLTILVGAFPPERRGSIVGIWGALGGLGVAGGPLVGGAVTQGLDWHWIFWVNVPIGIAAMLLALARLQESHGPATRVDVVGVGLIGGGATGLVYGLIRAGETAWRGADAAIAIVVGLALVAAFIVWESRATEPMVPLRLFRNRAFSAAIATSFLLVGSVFSAAFLVAQFFQIGLGYSPLESGLRVLPWTATPLFIAPIGGALSDRIGRRVVLFVGLLLQAAGFAWLAAVASTTTSYLLMALPLLIAGVGISLALPVAPTAAISAVAPADIGKASGVNSTVQRFGSAFAIALASAVFSANGQLTSAAAFTDGFRPALLVVAGLSALGGFAALAISSRAIGVRTQAVPTTAEAAAD